MTARHEEVLVGSAQVAQVWKDIERTNLNARVGLEIMGDQVLDKPTIVGVHGHERELSWKHNGVVMEDPPDYAGDIAEGWEVHIAMCERPFSIRQLYFREIQEQTASASNEGFLVAWPDVLVILRDRFPEVICRAALRAIGKVAA